MPLVDYASSDEASDNEAEVQNRKVIQPSKTQKTCVEKAKVGDHANNDNGELFTSLPKPRKTFSFLEDDNRLSKLLLYKNNPGGRRESVKISVPSVSEFKDDKEQPSPKKVKPSSKGAGLFSLLPPPKYTAVKQTDRNLVPHVLSKNLLKQSVSGTDTKSKVINSTSATGLGDEDDDDDDTQVGTSFFGNSLAQQNNHSECLPNESALVVETSSNSAEPEQSFVNGLPASQENQKIGLVLDENNYSYSTGPLQGPERFSASDNPLDLDEKALQILCGNKKKRQHMPMNVIDLSGEEVLPDSKEWLLKQFTEEKRVRSHSHKKNQGPSSQSRRKHQITYLAYQAKEQELELQNQWANNRMSRKQTQSKYGF